MRADLGCAQLVGVEVLMEDGAVGVCQHALDSGVLVSLLLKKCEPFKLIKMWKC